MLKFFQQENAQVMIVNNRDLQLFVWENKSLKFVSEFDGSQQSLEAFKQIQNTYKTFPAIFVTNFLEESFRSETIAPVSGSDRKALLERKLDYAFRKTPYRTASTIDKEKEGRKDHRVLLSGLTKPELLTPWIKILLANRTPVQSISSAAFLSETFATHIKLHTENYLLIASLENNFDLRQTYMRRGKVLFSRLTSLSSRTQEEIGKEIYKESVQIRSYLERVKLLPYEETLKINVYSIYDDSEINLNQKSSHLNNFESINIQQEIIKYPAVLNKNQLGSMIFFLCALIQQKKIKNTYAPPKVRKYYLLKNLGSALSYSSVALIILSLLISAPMFLDSLDLSSQRAQLQQQTQPLLVEYDLLSQRFPETPIPSKEMALVVETTEQIRNLSINPTEAMAYISSKINSSPNLQVTEINWLLDSTQADPFDPLAQQMRYLSMQNDAENAYKAAILDHRAELKVQISGMVYSSGSYREAQQEVEQFSNALAENSNVSVTQIQMPTDVRVDTQVSTTIDNNELRAPFTLQLDFVLL
jgi:hypothetical protein